ncbi:HlyD family efflux transporter periplasmic adaptor subunit [Streptomyces phytohabitans]|uniref:HlyD family efflux transporter periplasmic adaptor subunit n=1 Tax=Streptomyces phytohabitans TaxID=1150371 RepID=UPI00345B6445
MQLRQRALSKLEAPEELEIPVRLARPQGLLVLIVTVVFIAGAGVWATVGTISPKLNAPGILTYAQGSYVLQSPVAGQVVAVYAEEGKLLRKNAPVLKVRTETGERTVRAVAPGKVLSLAAKIGSVVTTGRDVATLESVKDPRDPLVALVYAPADKAADVPVGARVDLTVQSVPTQRFGVLRGKVKAVDRAPRSRKQITGFLGDEELAEQFSKDGPPVTVVVRLDTSDAGMSGYRWSSPPGPPFALGSMTLTRAALRLPDEHPVDWLLP